MKFKLKKLTPRARLTDDRRTGGAHRGRRELSAREELTMRLNELAQQDFDDANDFEQALGDVFGTSDLDEQNEEDYYDHLLDKLDLVETGRLH